MLGLGFHSKLLLIANPKRNANPNMPVGASLPMGVSNTGRPVVISQGQHGIVKGPTRIVGTCVNTSYLQEAIDGATRGGPSGSAEGSSVRAAAAAVAEKFVAYKVAFGNLIRTAQSRIADLAWLNENGKSGYKIVSRTLSDLISGFPRRLWDLIL